jgi:molybdenum cofactor biosynthesis enzyme MoaA
MSNIHNDTIKEKIYEQVLEDLNPLKMDMDLLRTFTQEEYNLLVDILTKHRWENYYD